MLVTLTFAALHINTNLYLCEFADAPTRGARISVYKRNKRARLSKSHKPGMDGPDLQVRSLGFIPNP